MILKKALFKSAFLFLLFLMYGCPLPPEPPVDHSTCKPTDSKEELIKNGTLISTLIKTNNGTLEKKDFFISRNKNGNIYTEDDILLLTEEHKRDGKAVSVPSNGDLWTHGIVPYTVEPRALSQLSKIESAIKVWEDHVNGLETDHKLIEFVYFPYHSLSENLYENYIVFEAGFYECSSFVGQIGGEQWVVISPECNLENTVHEIGHLLGLWHEQSRSDRDQYIQVLWCNIEDDFRYNFMIEPEDISIDISTYDFNSIMHYPALAFSNNGEPTLKSKIQGQTVPNERQNEIPSAKDIEAIQCLYDPQIECDFRPRASESFLSTN